MRRTRPWEIGALALALAVWGYLGWDSALWVGWLQLALHLIAGVAIGGLWLAWVRGGALPRTGLDRFVLVLLLAFGVASLSAWNAGLSARAMAAIVATAAMLPIALLALRHRPGWTALVVNLPIIGLSAGTLAVLTWRRVEWVLVGAPGLPPVRLAHEGTPFGSVAVPPFVILAAIPLALVIPWGRVRRAVLAALVALGVPLALLSGSRSAWIAIAVTAFVLGGPWAARQLSSLRQLGSPCHPRRPTRSALVVAAAILAAAALGIVYIAPRLDDISSLVYRENLWRDTLRAWQADPLFGIGPGSMPWARQAAAPDLSFPVNQPHSHNVLLGVLGDAGLVGVAAALALVVAFVAVAGPWRQRSASGRAAFAVLAGLAFGMMFEDLTFLPNFNLEVVLLVALALSGAGAVEWVQRGGRPLGWGRWLTAAAAASALLALSATGDAARIAYDAGLAAARQEAWPSATAWLQQSVALDPWHPSGPKSLAVAADRSGDPALALEAARRAVRLNPGDDQSWVNIGVLCRDLGDRDCVGHAADRALAVARPGSPGLANAAVLYAWLGDESAADRAYGLSLATNWWTAVTLRWPRSVTLTTNQPSELGESVAELNVVIARGFQGLELDPAAYRTAAARMLAEAAAGNRSRALAAADDLERGADASTVTWQLIALVRSAYGLDVAHELAVAEVANGRPLNSGSPGIPAAVTDIASFRAYPTDGLVADAVRLLPSRPWPWALEPMLAPVSRPAAGAG